MVQIKCLSNGLYSLKNSHIPFWQGFRPPLRTKTVWTVLFLCRGFPKRCRVDTRSQPTVRFREQLHIAQCKRSTQPQTLIPACPNEAPMHIVQGLKCAKSHTKEVGKCARSNTKEVQAVQKKWGWKRKEKKWGWKRKEVGVEWKRCKRQIPTAPPVGSLRLYTRSHHSHQTFFLNAYQEDKMKFEKYLGRADRRFAQLFKTASYGHMATMGGGYKVNLWGHLFGIWLWQFFSDSLYIFYLAHIACSESTNTT